MCNTIGTQNFYDLDIKTLDQIGHKKIYDKEEKRHTRIRFWSHSR